MAEKSCSPLPQASRCQLLASGAQSAWDLNTTVLWEFLKDMIHLSPAARSREGAGVPPHDAPLISINLPSSEQMALSMEMD